MKVRTIRLDDDEGLEGATVDMSLREIALLAKWVGLTTPSQREAAVAGLGETGSEVYDCLAGLCNRFFDDGVNGAMGAGR